MTDYDFNELMDEAYEDFIRVGKLLDQLNDPSVSVERKEEIICLEDW